MKNFSTVRLGETDDIKDTYEKEARRKLNSSVSKIQLQFQAPFSPAVHMSGCAKAFKFDLAPSYEDTKPKKPVTLSSFLTTRKPTASIITPQECLKEAKYELKVFLPS